MSVKLIIWDMDGVLVDSLMPSIQNVVDALQPYLKERKLDKKEIFDKVLGAHEETDILKFASSLDIPEKYHHNIQKSFIKIKNFRLKQIQIFEGIPDIILLAKKHSITQVLVTGRDKIAAYILLKSPRNKIKGKTLYSQFDIILAGDDYPGKYNAFKLMLEKNHVKPDETLVIGDEPNDIKHANSLEIISAAALWGAFTKKETLSANPKLIFKSTTTALKYLSKNI